MASAAALQYFNSFPPEVQQQITASWGGTDRMDEWYNNAVAAGAVPGAQAPGSTQAEEGGAIAPFMNAAPSSEWLGKRKPTTQELRRWAAETGRSEDYNRFSDAVVSGWLNDKNAPGGNGWWDIAGGTFKNKWGDSVDKPDETGPNTPKGYNGTGDAMGTGGGGGGGGTAARPAPAGPAPGPTTGYAPEQPPPAATTPLPTGQVGTGVGLAMPPQAQPFQFSAAMQTPSTGHAATSGPPAMPKIDIPDPWKSTAKPTQTEAPEPLYGQRQPQSSAPQFFSGGSASKRGWMGGGNWVTSDERLKDKGLEPLRFSDWRK